MEAFEYLKELKRMCKSIADCDNCPLESTCDSSYLTDEELKQQVSVVEKWSKEHPVRTRQSEFLKMSPNAPIINGVMTLCPQIINPTSDCDRKCAECRKRFWLSPIKTDGTTEEEK